MYANAAVNRHYHRISDGELIIHAHPFSKSGTDSHKHTNEEINFLAAIGNPDHLILLILTGLFLVFLNSRRILSQNSEFSYVFILPDNIRNKAPPLV